MRPARFGANRRSVARRWLALVLTALAACPWVSALAQPTGTDGWAAMQDGAVVLFRHATAPGGGDPPGFRLADCATQRNLDDTGRDQARRIGQAFRDRGIRVGAVASSQWCRARDTARLAFGQVPQEVEAFNSFFNTPDRREAQTSAARRYLASWRGPGVLVVTTHQVNITALTGITPASGEGIVVRAEAAGLRVLGRVLP